MTTIQRQMQAEDSIATRLRHRRDLAVDAAIRANPAARRRSGGGDFLSRFPTARRIGIA